MPISSYPLDTEIYRDTDFVCVVKSKNFCLEVKLTLNLTFVVVNQLSSYPVYGTVNVFLVFRKASVHEEVPANDGDPHTAFCSGVNDPWTHIQNFRSGNEAESVAATLFRAG